MQLIMGRHGAAGVLCRASERLKCISDGGNCTTLSYDAIDQQRRVATRRRYPTESGPRVSCATILPLVSVHARFRDQGGCEFVRGHTRTNTQV